MCCASRRPCAPPAACSAATASASRARWPLVRPRGASARGQRARLAEAVAALHAAGGAHGRLDAQHIYLHDGEVALAYPRDAGAGDAGAAGADAASHGDAGVNAGDAAERDREALRQLEDAAPG